MLLGLEISERYGLTADECISKLRETLESETSLQGCTAIDRQSGSLVKIEREHWRLWRLNCSHWGVELLPGLSDFRFPAEQVRAAFPPLAAPLPETSEGAVKVNGPSYRRKTITPQQNRIGLFLAFVDTHAKEKPEHSMRNFTQSRLHEEYKVWNHRRNKDPRCSREVPAVKLSGFKRWAKRYHDGERWV